VAPDEQEGRRAGRRQRCASHENQLTVHEARDLIALQRTGIKCVASMNALFTDHVD
jgi:hypothetical protein